MRIDGRFIYSSTGKVLDFAEPHYVLNEDH